MDKWVEAAPDQERMALIRDRIAEAYRRVRNLHPDRIDKLYEGGEKPSFNNLQDFPQREFSQYSKLYKEGGISPGSISKWIRLISIPGTESLLLISEMCECDLAFLVGEQSMPRREDASVHDAIGLSEEAISALVSVKVKSQFPIWKDDAFKNHTQEECVNWFIEQGILDVLDKAWMHKMIARHYESECEIPESLRGEIEKVMAPFAGVPHTDQDDKLFKEQIIFKLCSMSARKLKKLFADDYFSGISKYVDTEEDFNRLKCAAVMAKCIVDKSFPYLEYARDKDVAEQQVIKKFTRLLERYLKE